MTPAQKQPTAASLEAAEDSTAVGSIVSASKTAQSRQIVVVGFEDAHQRRGSRR